MSKRRNKMSEKDKYNNRTEETARFDTGGSSITVVKLDGLRVRWSQKTRQVVKVVFCS